MRISDWSSDVCSSDLPISVDVLRAQAFGAGDDDDQLRLRDHAVKLKGAAVRNEVGRVANQRSCDEVGIAHMLGVAAPLERHQIVEARSEEHTSELQSLMRISYAVFCLKKKNIHTKNVLNYV